MNKIVKLSLTTPLFYIFMFSCTNNNLNNWTYKLTFLKIKTYKLDSITLPYSDSYQFVNIQDTLFLTILNKAKNIIYYYEYNDCKLKHTIHISREQLSKGFKLDGHYILNNDSIFLLNYYNETLYLINSTGKIYNSYYLKRNFHISNHPPTPKLGSFNPLKIYKNKIFCTGYIGGEYTDEDENERPILIEYDMLTDKINYSINYPYKYTTSNWGGWHYRKVYCCFNGKKLLISFPASENIFYVENIDSMQLYKNNTTKKVQIKALCKNKRYNPTKKEITKHYLTNFYFGPIITDTINKLYYRIKYFPVKKYDLNNWKTWKRTFSIEIFDNKLNKCGEWKSSTKTFFLNSAFCTIEGLNIINIKNNEDEVSFSIYKPEIIKNEYK